MYTYETIMSASYTWNIIEKGSIVYMQLRKGYKLKLLSYTIIRSNEQD